MTERFCCDGRCSQGRDFPEMLVKPAEDLRGWAIFAGAAFFFCLGMVIRGCA